ncbi:DNA-binding protein HU-beta [Microbacterium phyllosphaerae]|uniref:DNA-binding protein HU-beta n=1 Tax=Microbacterium phyllosphaerae TaxID=124798 RepID=A0ABS4WSN7_9MICO|nr:HU family DNA-binding protein [Microbacterium phyllosphaerae]MBP2378968.1 DNA-binding protein HU-beta [Microbacterium phyllosphaerae]MCS3444302.1 DNA-binding protein HU-beta [Microbacterium phyllosphaerae]
MSTSRTLETNRVSKREFVQRFARRGGISVQAAQTAYSAMIDELLDLVGRGNTVTLTNFGKFYPQTHKGHRVQFAKDEGDAEVNDYTVLKFSATREVNRRVKVND